MTRHSKETVQKAARAVKGSALRDVDAGSYEVSEPTLNDIPLPKRRLDQLPPLKKPCEQCPWRLSNQGKRHFGSFYSKKNLIRLWNQVRNGQGVQSCHLTDPSHPDHIAAGAKENAEPRECPGSVILVMREIHQMKDAEGVVSNDGVLAYLKRRKKGITKMGVVGWIVSRIQHGGVPFIGGPKMIEVDVTDEDIGLPDYLKEG